MAAADYIPLVQSLYVSYFGRPADTFGLANFAAQLDALKAPTTLEELNVAVQTDAKLKVLVNSFSGSAESAALYGTGDTVAFVSAIYANLLNRTPDFDGLVYWVNAINSGQLTRANASLAIASATSTNTTTQGQADAALIDAKVAVATAFTTAINTGEELAAYSGAAAAASARNLLAQVLPTTVPAQFQSTVEASIAQIVIDSLPKTNTNLSVGIDTLPGTSANDTFNALSINAQTGADATTLGGFDNLNGGAGNDTLNIYTKAGFNDVQQGTVTSVETINIFNEGTAAADQFGEAAGVDASKFVGANAIWQLTNANKVVNLGNTTTAGFKGVSTNAAALNVAAAGATATVALDAVTGNAASNVVDLDVSGASVSSVNVSGTLAKALASGNAASLDLDVVIGKDVTALTLNTVMNTDLTIDDSASAAGKKVSTVNAAASVGNITFSGDADVATLTTGAGADTLGVTTATVLAATGVTAVSATVASGAGNDTVTIATTGNGLTTVDTGAGDDTLNITARSSGKLTINLGDGTDKFSSTQAINATDSINAGGGVDTLLLSLVGSANIGAFSGFDSFDLVGLGTKTLDVDILASKNTVTEFVTSGDIAGTATLTNIGANVGFRATADMAASSVVLTQKTAGAITVTVDADETGNGDVGADAVAATVSTNATSTNLVFDTAYLAAISGEATVADNETTLNVTASAAKTVTVVSGGANATNILNFNGGEATTLTVTGASGLVVGTTVAAKLATIDSSAATGGIEVSTADVINKGNIKLGSGSDTVIVAATSVVANIETVTGFEKSAAAAVGSDAAAATAAQADADVLSFGAAGTAVLGDGAVANGAVSKGVLTFTGAGPADLAAAITIATTATAAGQVVAFEFVGSTYVVADTGEVIGLSGTTGVTQLAEVGAVADTFFIV